MCETYTTLGFQTQLILNRLRNERELLELSEEAAPCEQRELSERAQEKNVAVEIRVGPRLLIQSERRCCLKPEPNSNDPLRDAHSDRPDDREEKSANGEETPDDSKETKSDPKADREAIERRLRDISEFERRYHDGAVNSGAVRPCAWKKKRLV